MDPSNPSLSDKPPPVTAHAHPHRRRQFISARTCLILVALSPLLGIAISLGLARAVVVPDSKPWRGNQITNVIGPDAATHPLPVRTPHAQAWPPAHQWSEYSTFAHRRVGTWHVDAGGQTTHQIDARFYGWPAACLQDVRLWWPGNDPAWNTSAPRQSGLRVIWRGLLLDALAFSAMIVLAIVLPWWGRTLIRRSRLRRGLCPACAYAIGVSSVCTECGEVVAATVIPAH